MSSENSVNYIIKILQKSGFSGYIAGGAVRDIILKKPPQDFDVLTNASMEQIHTIFSDQKIKKVGKSFPVHIINGIEVSSGRAGFEKSNFPESDLARRDFTVNAMAYDPVTKNLIDPFKGREDLKNRVIRFTNNSEARIKEDPLRMIRACRFTAMVNGYISKSSLKAMLDLKDLLDSSVAKERIGHEIIKAMALEKPSLFFKALHETQLLPKIFPSLDQCHDLDGGPHHGETVFEHCMLVGDVISPRFPILRLAGFLHDAGKFDAAKIKEGN
ncbi:MAG: CCA tRNA nucleotidyltransferase, partial [Desulfobacula sp.]|nr:CCA tRNA nucleotidyltransferase [Desulfobacula sp.]